MSSLFDDNFLTGLQPAEDGPPPPPEDHAPEAVPEGLFEGVYDAPPPPRDGYYRDGHPRPVIDSAALLDGLNTEQRAAVVHAGSPLLIVAGAGSGKTRVLTHRIAHLLAERGTHPGQILAITFTNKAAGEMKERVEQLVGPRANAMWVMTFHSACVRILRRESKKLGFTSSFSIYDAADSKRLMALVCRDLDLDPKRYPPKSFTAKVSNLKNELIDEETFAGQAADGFEKTLAQAYALYQARLREANALDFDDIIMTTVHLLQAFPDVAEHYRRRFRHVLVDEYQDTNHAQYTLVRELVGPAGKNDAPAELCVVGDADQSIYAFRGATIRNILQFEEDYPSATTILLEQNYRSTQTILSAANAVIERNESRRPKNLWTNAGSGARITGYVADTEHDEAQFVADEIDRLTDAGDAKAGDVAVFYRTNAQSRVFEEIFIRVGLPYKVVGGVRFYERKEVRDVLAYLRVLANPEDTVPLRRILNVPKRGIGDRAEAMIDALSMREKISFPQALRRVDEAYGMAARSSNAVKRFNTLMEELRTIVESGAGPAVVLEAVLERTGYLAELQGLHRPAGRDPYREPPGTRRRRPRIRAGARRGGGRGHARGVPGEGRARRGLRPDPRRGRGRLRRHHADDPAHGEGPGVPRRLPHRPGGRRLPAHAGPRPDQGAGGGAPPRVRRHHPRPRTALSDPGRDAQRLGPALVQPAVAVPGGDPGSAPGVEAQGPDGRPRRAHLRHHVLAVLLPLPLRPLGLRDPALLGQADGRTGRRGPGHARPVRPGHGDGRRGPRRPGQGDGRLRRRAPEEAAPAVRAGREALGHE
ncbi:superfamily I DNA/RNA helicase [Streptomyces sp. HB202]|nr:superfamily I DNA/RNA helicase [Streptomyces sp. HB202]